MVGSVGGHNEISRYKLADDIKNMGESTLDKAIEKNVFEPIEQETKLEAQSAAANNGGMINTVK